MARLGRTRLYHVRGVVGPPRWCARGLFRTQVWSAQHSSDLTPPQPISKVELPFTPKLVRFLAEKPQWTKVALWYLEHSRLFSQIRLLEWNPNSHKARKVKHELLSTEQHIIDSKIRAITSQAFDALDASGDSSFGESKVARGETLETRLAWLAVGLVSDRKKSPPTDVHERKTIRFNLFIVIALTYEAFVGYGPKDSYFHRQLAAASERATNSKRTTTTTTPTTPRSAATSKSATRSKHVATSKRTITQIHADSARVESSNVDHENQPAKKRKK